MDIEEIIIYLKPEHFKAPICDILREFGDADLMQEGLGDEFEAVFKIAKEGHWSGDDYEVDQVFWQFKSIACLKGDLLSNKGKSFAQYEIPCQLGPETNDAEFSEGDL